MKNEITFLVTLRSDSDHSIAEMESLLRELLEGFNEGESQESQSTMTYVPDEKEDK